MMLPVSIFAGRKPQITIKQADTSRFKTDGINTPSLARDKNKKELKFKNIVSLDTIIVRTQIANWPQNKGHIELILNFVVGLGGICFGAWLTTYFNAIKERKDRAFTLYNELNSSEMSILRHQANDLLQSHISSNIIEIDTIDDTGRCHAIYVVIRFYQRLWFAIHCKMLDSRLAIILFDDLFYFWYYIYFQNALLPIGWKAGNDLKQLAEWFEQNLTKERHNFLLNDKFKERESIINKFE